MSNSERDRNIYIATLKSLFYSHKEDNLYTTTILGIPNLPVEVLEYMFRYGNLQTRINCIRHRNASRSMFTEALNADAHSSLWEIALLQPHCPEDLKFAATIQS